MRKKLFLHKGEISKFFTNSVIVSISLSFRIWIRYTPLDACNDILHIINVVLATFNTEV